MAQFVNAYFNGQLSPAVKSAPRPAEGARAGWPEVIVGSSLRDEVLEDQRDVLLCIHPPYGFDELNATLHRLAALLAGVPSMRIATFDAMANAFVPSDLPDVERYEPKPTLVLLTGSGQKRAQRRYTAKYGDKGPKLKSLLSFLRKHSATTRDSWEVVKAALNTAREKDARIQQSGGQADSLEGKTEL
jgi:hypothetical protein